MFWTIEDLAKQFKLTAFELDDDFVFDLTDSHVANFAKLKDDDDQPLHTEEEAEELGQKEADEVIADHYSQWETYVTTNMERLLKEYDLELISKEIFYKEANTKRLSYSFKPTNGWMNSAQKLLEVVNGVGYFHFNNVLAFMRENSCKSYKETVFSHLSYINKYAEVYGGRWPYIKLKYKD